MGIRGELYTTQVMLDNRSYFFNVKENRMGDVFLQIVESKNKNGEEFDRHAIVVFADDMQKFFRGLDESVDFIDKNQKAKRKAAAARKEARAAKSQFSFGERKKIYKKKSGDDMRETPHIASMRPRNESDDEDY